MESHRVLSTDFSTLEAPSAFGASLKSRLPFYPLLSHCRNIDGMIAILPILPYGILFLPLIIYFTV